jgi:hypothetical protein
MVVVMVVVVMVMVVVTMGIMALRGVAVRTMPMVRMIRLPEGDHIRLAGRPVRQKARDAGDQEAEQRQKDNCRSHYASPLPSRMICSEPQVRAGENRNPLFGIMRQPFITLMSSTAIVPRLRK